MMMLFSYMSVNNNLNFHTTSRRQLCDIGVFSIILRFFNGTSIVIFPLLTLLRYLHSLMTLAETATDIYRNQKDRWCLFVGKISSAVWTEGTELLFVDDRAKW